MTNQALPVGSKLDPRIGAKEMASIHAAAVTRNYSVEPRLGTLYPIHPY